ncbi:MAG: dihydroxyacetone kinase subunit DhaK [Oscillospiraceae bacterium]|nr:dihydroxyacetone kinase subunit DhaK [Oscillospiraceae bacterium]
MKKIINEPANVVPDTLEGLALSDPTLVYSKGFEVISRKERREKVGLVSGGGSGHEPAHAGYVGKGMLDAAVAGNVFASPGPEGILEGINMANNGKGVLLVIKNYSGDIMNFDMAKELAEMDGIEVESVIVKDDVAVPDSTYSTGRRGIAGTIFVHKLAGAKAEMGGSLAEVKDVALKTIENIRSIGMSMSSCILPAVGKPGFTIEDNEMEVGMGIHGEPGVERTAIRPSKELAEILVSKILEDYDYIGSEVALMVNGLGGTALMELYILNKDVHELLESKNVKVYKTLVGNYMTSMEMAGCSITLLKLDDELKELLDFPCETPALKL